MGIEGIFVFCLLEYYISSNQILYMDSDFFILLEIKLMGGNFPAAFSFTHFLCFSFIFSTAKHPLRMTTQGMVG